VPGRCDHVILVIRTCKGGRPNPQAFIQ